MFEALCFYNIVQPRVIFYINLVELETQMLQAKFQDHRMLVLEEMILTVLIYMDTAAILIM